MKRRVVTIAVVLLVVAGVGAGTGAAAYFEGYSAAGEWFSPGEMYGSGYDWCRYWVNNTFSKGSSAHGLITFIDVNGNWRYGKQGTGVLSRDLSWAETYGWRKKLHCRNNSSVGYQGGCFGLYEPAQCA